MFCEKCGVSLPDGTSFCTQCGADLRAAAPVQPAPTPTPAPAPVQNYIQPQPAAPAPTMPAYAPTPQTPPAPTTAGTGFRIVNCILAPFALVFALLSFGASLEDVFDSFSSASSVLTGLLSLVSYSIMVFLTIWLLAVATKREYRTGGATVPLALYVFSTLAFWIINLLRYGGDVMEYYVKTKSGREQLIPFVLLFVALVFYWMLIKSVKRPRPSIWPAWLVLIGLAAGLAMQVVYVIRMLDYSYGIAWYVWVSRLYYVLFYLIQIFMVIRIMMLAKRNVPLAGRPQGGQYVPTYVPPTYQNPYGR